MRKSIPTLGVVSAGLLLAASPAQAVDTNMSSNLNVGIANGIQGHLPIQAPINVCGNAIGLLGSASAYCGDGANANFASGQQNLNLQYVQAARHLARGQQWPGQQGGLLGGLFGGSGGGASDLSSNLNVGAANGIQVDAQVQAPVNVCGNAIGILGDAIATCVAGANADAFSPTVQSSLFVDNGLGRGSDNGGGNAYVLPYGNTQPRPIAPAAKPGAAKPTAAKPSTGTPTAVKPTGVKTTAVKAAPGKQQTAPRKKAEQGLLGNLLAPVTSLLGGVGGGGWAGERCGDTDMSTFGNVGLANGIQAQAPIQAPINLAGNALGLAGSASAYAVGGANAKYCS